MAILKAVEKSIALEVKEKFAAKKYFEGAKNVYPYYDFAQRIVNKAKAVKAETKFSVASYDLSKPSTDAGIEAELPKDHIFSESEVCAVIAELIAKQPKGEKGDLLSNGNWNLLYTPAFVVGVRWRGGSWDVDAWPRDGGRWRAGDRVFSPAAEN